MSDAFKQAVAHAALEYVGEDKIIGVGTGSTANYFIEALTTVKHRVDACVASSVSTEVRLRAAGFTVLDLNVASDVAVYFDGADEVNPRREMIKGGGGALTREKILATASKQFVCLVAEHKCVKMLGAFPVAVEVLPMARSLVARALVKLGGNPAYRDGFVTDNGNIILDVHQLPMTEPIKLEATIKAITGVVDCGIFAKRTADIVLVSGIEGVRVL